MNKLVSEQLFAHYKWLHQQPEPGFAEDKTKDYVKRKRVTNRYLEKSPPIYILRSI